jgi:ArsR family transcriptional regulator
MPHERSEYRQTLGHQWQGFAEEQVLGWFKTAGLTGGVCRPLPPEASAKGPLLFTAAARRET